MMYFDSYRTRLEGIGFEANEIIKTTVTFSFRYWETLDTTRQKPSLTDKIYDTVINTVQRNIDRNIPKVLTRLF